ncbi:hypothetical protein L596_001181 [Steinernema carpocapsae]|uniref:RING-CH-type domain-containing protein n=1 Tax=Steinernema carpocapsae TaxID=34508 RepID=A0A4U8UL21_STECR|nr:hypothetical protein L596_001181 [Steinernema carpocapsae]
MHSNALTFSNNSSSNSSQSWDCDVEVVAEDDNCASKRQCKYCFSDEDVGRWLTPCKCSGSIRYVHSVCFDHWLKVAPFQQQSQCSTCKHIYKKHWELKSPQDWCLPHVDLSVWDSFEILLDVYSTMKLIRGFLALLNGRRAVFAQIGLFTLWRSFIFTNQRVHFYINVGRNLLTSILQPVVDEDVD